MNYAVYGAGLSGYYCYNFLKYKEDNILFYIDKNPKSIYKKINSDIPVFTDFESADENLKNKLEIILIALGDPEVAKKIKKEFKEKVNIPVYTIYDSNYKEIYDIFKFYYNPNTYLSNIGFNKSQKTKSCVDALGRPIPWIPYTVIDLLEERLCSNFKVFEWGSGNSTIWWQNKVKRIISIEHNKEWFEYVKEKINPKRSSLIYKELDYGGDYCKEILKHTNIDIIVIDGRDRVNCAKNAINSLSPSGVIIWDDTKRENYLEGFNYLISHGFKMLTFTGLKPLVDRNSYCSIFYRNENCLGL